MTVDTWGLLKVERYIKERRVFILKNMYFKSNAGEVHNFRSKYDRNCDLTSSPVKRDLNK